MRKKSKVPSVATDMRALAGLYANLLREMGRQARGGHAWPPHRHSQPSSSNGNGVRAASAHR